MQLQPVTMRFIARKEGIALPPEEIFRDPLLSCRLAVRYLAYLQRAYRGDIDLALMAYNAGPTRVNNILEQQERDFSPFDGYPRNVRRRWRILRAHPALARAQTAPQGG